MITVLDKKTIYTNSILFSVIQVIPNKFAKSIFIIVK